MTRHATTVMACTAHFFVPLARPWYKQTNTEWPDLARKGCAGWVGLGRVGLGWLAFTYLVVQALTASQASQLHRYLPSNVAVREEANTHHGARARGARVFAVTVTTTPTTTTTTLSQTMATTTAAVGTGDSRSPSPLLD